ncbi:hypothetical protein AG0111_0g7177 [Alternaria gaisen]|uniref:Uncharacterized protein n=1 Tax=Alternaria gaisen TaxID=167740 RepID=A0ACB6FKE7_9PLEO|nr:hypothetical protein AG0111_0g7177 [Alternaria gaisen]
MADPLSIAGSVVGITAAGLQASVKLYALAEKVATASQRVTSIADDVSSTCAILNQVRELIIPQHDAQGTLKSVFNSTALHDISHGLQRCRSTFMEIEAFLRRAFEQVGKRPALRSKIELTRFEKAKWPFLQPQFDELRNDLRDAKGNLILMIAVASLALAQRDGRQRPIHETERLELVSTIVQLQQARISDSNDQNSLKRSQQEGMASRRLFGQSTTVDPARDTRSEQTSVVSVDPESGFRTVKYMRATSLSPQGDTKSTALVSERTSDPSSADAKIVDANLSLPSISNVQMQEQWSPDMSNPSIEEANINSAILPHTAGSTACFGRQTRDFSGSLQEPHTPGHDTSRTPALAMSASDRSAVDLVYEEQPGATSSTATPSTQCASENTLYYCGWITRHLKGLTTGFGDSVSITQMNLPDQSLEKLVKKYADAGLDPHISLLDLTEQQQDMIKQAMKTNPGAAVAYISVSRDIKVSSVFGMLNISGLKWIAASREPWSKLESMAQISHVSPQPFLPARAGPPPPRPYDDMSFSVNSRPHPPAPPSEEQRADSRAKERAEKHLAEKEKDRAVAREEHRRLKDEERRLKEEERLRQEQKDLNPPAQLADQQRLIEFEKAQMRSERQFAEARERDEELAATLKSRQEKPSYYFPRGSDLSPSIACHDNFTSLPAEWGQTPSKRRTSMSQPIPPAFDTGYEQSSQHPQSYAQQYQAPTEENGEDIVNELLARWTTLENLVEESHQRPDNRLKDDKHGRYSRRRY